jgi:uncharacterized protein (TIGR00297 family)
MLFADPWGGFGGADAPLVVLFFDPVPVDGPVPLVVVPVCCAMAFWLRMVKLSGALAGTAVSLAVAHGAGWCGLAMLAALLGLGHATTVRSRRRRGAWQVLCNGGVAGVAALFASAWGLVAMAGALATSLSDTAGGELGQRFGGTPRFLLLGRPVPPGTDGGMSVFGTVTGLVMAAMVPLAGWAAGAVFDMHTIVAVAAGGFACHFLDSFIGGTLQRYLGSRGNDWTNLLATGAGALVAVTFLSYIAPGEVFAAQR